MRLQSLRWSLGDEKKEAPAGADTSSTFVSLLEQERFTAELEVEFLNAPAGNQQLRQMLDEALARLRKALPECEVAYAKLPSGLREDEAVSLTFDRGNAEGEETNVLRSVPVQIKIKGQVKTIRQLPPPSAAKADTPHG